MEVRMVEPVKWWFWNSRVPNEVKEIPWQELNHHPDFEYENGVHYKKFAHHIELWVNCPDENMAITKMQAVPDFRDSHF